MIANETNGTLEKPAKKWKNEKSYNDIGSKIEAYHKQILSYFHNKKRRSVLRRFCSYLRKPTAFCTAWSFWLETSLA